MNDSYKIEINDIENLFGGESDANMFRARVNTLFEQSQLPKNKLYVFKAHDNLKIDKATSDSISSTKREGKNELPTPQYMVSEAQWKLPQVILSPMTKDEIDRAITLLRHSEKIFTEWNLSSVIPNIRTSLNFYGPPGTGKTMTAHAIANHLDKKIMILNYAQIESKFVGDAPKNIDAAFSQAEKDNCVLFFDEADSLLGKRISNVSTGSEQAINSLRSQVLIAIENFTGLVIFATNFVENYDIAFESRIKSIHFEIPDYEGRLEIWKKHLPNELPLSACVIVEELAKTFDDFVGRDIRNAVLNAATDAVFKEQASLTMANFNLACSHIKATRFSKIGKKQKSNVSDEDKAKLTEKIKQELAIAQK